MIVLSAKKSHDHPEIISFILNPILPNSQMLVAIYTMDEISIHAVDLAAITTHIISSQKMHLPLYYWTFVGNDVIFLLMKESGFSWKYAQGKSGRPTKIFDRMDISSFNAM
jgi:hypothetical protein